MEPTTYKEILSRPDKELWFQAMQKEYNSLISNGTWEIVDLPSDRKAIKNKWVYKLKQDKDGNIERYKARLVVKGCSQRYGIDYEEVYSPVVRYTSIRYLMTLTVQLNLKIYQMDAVTAFLQRGVK